MIVVDGPTNLFFAVASSHASWMKANLFSGSLFGLWLSRIIIARRRPRIPKHLRMLEAMLKRL